MLIIFVSSAFALDFYSILQTSSNTNNVPVPEPLRNPLNKPIGFKNQNLASNDDDLAEDDEAESELKRKDYNLDQENDPSTLADSIIHNLYISALEILRQREKFTFESSLKQFYSKIDDVVAQLEDKHHREYKDIGDKLEKIKKTIKGKIEKQYYPAYKFLISKLSPKIQKTYMDRNAPVLLNDHSDLVADIIDSHRKLPKIRYKETREKILKDNLDKILVYLIHSMHEFLEETTKDRKSALQTSLSYIDQLLRKLNTRNIHNYDRLLKRYKLEIKFHADRDAPKIILTVLKDFMTRKGKAELKDSIKLVDKRTKKKIKLEDFEETSFEIGRRMMNHTFEEKHNNEDTDHNHSFISLDDHKGKSSEAIDDEDYEKYSYQKKRNKYSGRKSSRYDEDDEDDDFFRSDKGRKGKSNSFSSKNIGEQMNHRLQGMAGNIFDKVTKKIGF